MPDETRGKRRTDRVFARSATDRTNNRWLTHVGCALCLLAAPFPAVTQDLSFVTRGDLVRVARSQPNRLPNWMTGWVADATFDGLRLTSTRSSRLTFQVPWSWMTRLQISRGRKRKTVTGLVVGLLVGVPVGATAGWIRDTGVNDLSTRQSVQRGMRIGVLAGFVLGGIVGTLMEVERWHDVSELIP